MAMTRKSSDRTFDVLNNRIKELGKQEQGLERRRGVYEKLHELDAIERLVTVKSEPLQERLHHAFFTDHADEHRADLLELIEDLPPTSAGIANQPFTTKIGIISDLFLYKSMEGLADFRPIYPENYQQHKDLDILLLVTTWRGIDGFSWRGLTANNSDKRSLLFEQILPFYRRRGIPIVFYSKEDPPNYDQFLSFAQQADYIFTSAEEMIPKYQKDCPNAQAIDVLPFGINPKSHSPIGSQQGNVKKVIPFAGSWFNHKYKPRARWGGHILDAVVASKEYSLIIFDRNSEIEDPRYKFPNRYARSLTAAIDHELLLGIQRLCDLGINLNSVPSSTTMFANRAIELLAQGTFVLSNYNVGLNSRYPQIHLSNGYPDTLATLDNLDEAEIRRVQAAGIRSVFSNDLAITRVAKILRIVGLEAEVMEPRVAVLKHNNDERLSDDMLHQTYDNVTKVVDAVDATEEELTTGLRGKADIIVQVDSAYEYAPTHIEDLVNAFRYTDATAVEKIPPKVDHQSAMARHSYAQPSNVKTLGAEYVGTVPETISPQPGYYIDDIGIRRRSESVALSERRNPAPKPPILSVVVPIYNNGAHLLYKCIASLRRSSIFEQMEIILVDDGSTDFATLYAIEQLQRELNWVQVYRYEPGGSGSASRPRNKGLELASCDFVTYLDPDNEALNDAYVKLLRAVLENDVDFAVGDMTRWREGNYFARYPKVLRNRLGIEGQVGVGGATSLVDLQFKPISIQAIVARTTWLRETGITQPVGAVGQDSYFFQQMLYYADTFAIVDVPAHTYYTQVANSVVNTVNAKFFEKYLPLEKARSTWLSKVGLLEDYKRTRVETFFTGWYLAKLADVPPEEREQAISTIIELVRMYGEPEWVTKEAQEFWSAVVEQPIEIDVKSEEEVSSLEQLGTGTAVSQENADNPQRND